LTISLAKGSVNDLFRGKGLSLDGIPDHPRVFPIYVEEADAGTVLKTAQLRPFFREVALLPTGSNETQLAPPLPIEAPAIIAFYSFKGGVGRTTPSLGMRINGEGTPIGGHAPDEVHAEA
jgi:hypothetical protein